MNIFDFKSYREFINAWIALKPNKGRGVAKKIAESLGVSTVLMSQILKGARSLQLDHAYGIAEFINLAIDEKDYFLLLVQYENAGNYKYKTHLENKIKKISKEKNKLSNKVVKSIKLSEQDNAKFYSHWHYSALRLASDVKELNTLDSMCKRFDISETIAKDILNFLVEKGLCKNEGGLYKLGANSTHLERESPWIFSRQLQWRQKSIQMMEKKREEDLFYTAPMVLSIKDSKLIRKLLIESISEIVNQVQESPSEELMCLNIDWFKF